MSEWQKNSLEKKQFIKHIGALNKIYKNDKLVEIVDKKTNMVDDFHQKRFINQKIAKMKVKNKIYDDNRDIIRRLEKIRNGRYNSVVQRLRKKSKKNYSKSLQWEKKRREKNSITKQNLKMAKRINNIKSDYRKSDFRISRKNFKNPLLQKIKKKRYSDIPRSFFMTKMREKPLKIKKKKKKKIGESQLEELYNYINAHQQISAIETDLLTSFGESEISENDQDQVQKQALFKRNNLLKTNNDKDIKMRIVLNTENEKNEYELVCQQLDYVGSLRKDKEIELICKKGEARTKNFLRIKLIRNVKILKLEEELTLYKKIGKQNFQLTTISKNDSISVFCNQI